MYCSEEQRAVVESEDQYVLLNGVAGAQKTSTLCLLCKKLYGRGKNVLIVTLVGSVTNEIRQRIEVYLGIAFVQQGNHFLGGGPDHFIEIANYDAMLHKQLSTHKDPFLLRYGDCFDEKAQLMYEKYVLTGKHREFYMNNGRCADVVMMDEFQDLQPRKARILTTILKNNGGLGGVAAGDCMQSIFEHAFEEDEKLPMAIWREELGAAYFTMTRCFRCPKAHVDVINALLEPYVPRYGAPPMIATNDDVAHRPLFFTCPQGAGNANADVIAKQVSRCVARLRDIEPTLAPADVAIIMSKSNNNAVFRQIERRLAAVYESWGHRDAIKVFETKGDGVVMPINWAKAEGKTVMLSIHGDKGKGHKVVFFLGLTEGAIPSKSRLYTEKELIDISLLNVAMTRSTRWLFVGIAREWPSRYVCTVPLDDLAVLSWRPDTYEGTPFEPMCTAINACYHDHMTADHQAPKFDNPKYITKRAVAPQKLMCEVKADISFMYEHPKHIVPFYPWCNANTVKFGTRCNNHVGDDVAAVFGTMGELMFQRYCCMRNGTMRNLADRFGFLLDDARVHYTLNEKLMNIVQDSMIHESLKNMSYMMFVGTYNQICSNHRNYISEKTLREIAEVTGGGRVRYVLPAAMRLINLKDDVRLFLDAGVENRAVPTKTFWNVAIADIMLYNRIRVPCLTKHIDHYTADLTDLHRNIESFFDIIKNVDITFHQEYRVTGVEKDPDVLDEMGLGDALFASYGIRGVSDFESANAICEIKCPVSAKYSNNWTLQPLLYHCLNVRHDKSIDEMNVVDLTNGMWYQFPNMDKINKKQVLKSVLTKLKYREEHIKVLLAQTV